MPFLLGVYTMKMKLLMENFNSYVIEEMEKSFEELYENQNKKLNENAKQVAKYMKQLNMIAKKPEQFLKKSKASVEKKIKKAQIAMGADPDQLKKGNASPEQPKTGNYANSKEAAAAAMSDPQGALAKINKDLKADQQAIKQLDKAGDQAIKQAEPNEMEKIKKADAEVNVIFDQSQIMSRHIFDQFKKAVKEKNMQLMNAAQSDFIGFGKYSDNAIADATKAFKSKNWDELSNMSNQFKTMVQKMVST